MISPEEQTTQNRSSNRLTADHPGEGEAALPASLRDVVPRPHFVLDPADDGRVDSAEAFCPRAVPADEKSLGEKVEEKVRLGLREELDPPHWRNLVSAKVNRYKSRRPRPERYPSLQLKFEQRPGSRVAPAEGPARSSAQYSTASTAPDFEPRESELAPPAASETSARVLEFPRPLAPPIRTDELAEPILNRPRIVEAPELLPPPPAMGGILIESLERPEPERRPGFDMPLASATLTRRAAAGMIDALVVTLAVVAFAQIFLRLSDAQPGAKTISGLVAGLLAVLWPIYQFVLVVYSGTTPGLRLCGLRIERFDGTPAPRKVRGWRVVVSMLSAISLAIGYLWCFLDEDQLSWHDRITSTHLAATRVKNPVRHAK